MFIRLLLMLLPFPLYTQPIVVGELIGQLGNQMFIIAATVSLALDNGAIPIFPDLVNNPNDNIPINRQKIFFRLNAELPSNAPARRKYVEPFFNYAPIPYQSNMEIFGYFQSEKYFAHHKREILKLFAPSSEIVSYLTSHYRAILRHPNTVAVHARSYYDFDPLQTSHITHGREYLEKAMGFFPDDALFVVFSNDMSWCKTLLSHIPRKMIFIEGEPHYHDLHLMSMCKHNIISNSSFSWWAAYLNRNPDKIVIAPKVWFNPARIPASRMGDLIPNGWIVIE